MNCVKCNADFASDQLKCPYCGAVNEHALKLAKELQVYDKEYEKTRNELLETGTSLVLKRVTIGMGLIFLLIGLSFAAYVGVYNYRYAPSSKYQVTGIRYEQNKKLLKKCMDNKEYIRAYLLAYNTDPTHEQFKYYPEYAKELQAIFTYSVLFYDIEETMEDMDNGDNYKAFTESLMILCWNFFQSPASSVKDELSAELEQYLRNLYRLTDEEIAQLKRNDYAYDFKIEGSEDFTEITKERMVEYFGS